MILASTNPISHLSRHVSDVPWHGCQVEVLGLKLTLMSSRIAAMILVAAILIAVIVPGARKARQKPRGLGNLLESIVVFVRDFIGRPALHEKTDAFLPFLVTMFLFVLGLNLFGMLPLGPVLHWLSGPVPWLAGRPVGGTATSVPTVCAGLASLTLLTILACGLWKAARNKHEKDHWPMWLAVPASPVLWLASLSPKIPGPIGRILLAPLAMLELVGTVVKCFALMIRLAANMLAGHILLAVLMIFALQAVNNALEVRMLYLGVSALCVLGSVGVTILDLLIAMLQAYIFTFLSAMFLGLYVQPDHHVQPEEEVH